MALVLEQATLPPAANHYSPIKSFVYRVSNEGSKMPCPLRSLYLRLLNFRLRWMQNTLSSCLVWTTGLHHGNTSCCASTVSRTQTTSWSSRGAALALLERNRFDYLFTELLSHLPSC